MDSMAASMGKVLDDLKYTGPKYGLSSWLLSLV